MSEDIDDGLPKHQGIPLITTVYFDYNHIHDQVTHRSVSGVISFVGLTPISWEGKRQGTINICSYSPEFCSRRVANEEAITLRYMLKSLCVPVKVASELCGKKLGMIISCTNPDSDLKNKHVDISYHKLRVCTADGIFNPIKVCTMVTQSDIFTKCVLVVTLGSLYDASYGVDWA